MKELKIIIWDKVNEQWAGHQGFRGEMHCDRHHTPWIWSITNEENIKYFEFYQYTGQNDLDGKEIFDGHIVKEFWQFKDRATGQIQNRISIWKVWWSNDSRRWNLGNNGGECALTYIRKLKVIGHIKTNPELLKNSSSGRPGSLKTPCAEQKE